MSVHLKVNSSQELSEKIKQDYPGKQVLVDYWATWCPPCKAMNPILDELHESGDVVVVKIDVDENQQIAAENQIRSIPTMQFWKDGELNKETVIGAASASQIRNHVS